MREWGEKVWVQIEGGDKLGGHVHEGKWLDLDEKSKGMRIYWPETKTVSVKQNIYIDKSSVSHLKEEEEDRAIEMNPDLPANPQKSTFSTNTLPDQPSIPKNPHNQAPSESQTDEENNSEPEKRLKHT